jgi:hypothetical protein
MKDIKTTINFLQERLDIVISLSLEHGISYKEVIRRCVMMFISHMDKDAFEEHALTYQPDNENWKKVHFKMSPEEYDVYFDCKKVCRCSFSLIVAMAIDTYLESVLNRYQEFSYRVDIYKKFCILEENLPIYLFSWVDTNKIQKITEILRQ